MQEPAGRGEMEDFVALLSQNHAALQHFVSTLVPNPADADDIVQEACIAIWRRFSEFDPSRSFYRWACGVALIEIRRHRQRSSRTKLWFCQDVLSQLANELMSDSPPADARKGALKHCLQKLTDRDRDLLAYRYDHGLPVKDIGDAIDRPESTVYKMLLRVRSTLADCIRARLAQERHPNG